MKLFDKFEIMISEAEKKFDLNIKRVKQLNQMIFEYEHLSVESYAHIENKYLGNNSFNLKQETSNNFLLFNSTENQEVKAEFDQMDSEMSNPFRVLKLWMRFELYEIHALQECYLKRKEVQKVYDSAMDTASSNLEEIIKLERGDLMNTWWRTKDQIQKKVDEMNGNKIKW